MERQNTGQALYPKHSTELVLWSYHRSCQALTPWLALRCWTLHTAMYSCLCCHWKPDAAAIATIPWPEWILRHSCCFESPAPASKSREDASAWLHPVPRSQMSGRLRKEHWVFLSYRKGRFYFTRQRIQHREQIYTRATKERYKWFFCGLKEYASKC